MCLNSNFMSDRAIETVAFVLLTVLYLINYGCHQYGWILFRCVVLDICVKNAN